MVRGLIAFGLLFLVLLEWGGMMVLREAAEQWERHERWEAFEASELPRTVLILDVGTFLQARQGFELRYNHRWYDVMDVRWVGSTVHVLAIDDAEEELFRARFEAQEKTKEYPASKYKQEFKWKNAGSQKAFTLALSVDSTIPSISFTLPTHVSWIGWVTVPPPEA